MSISRKKCGLSVRTCQLIASIGGARAISSHMIVNGLTTWLIVAVVFVLSSANVGADELLPRGRCCFWSGQGFECMGNVSEMLCDFVDGDWIHDATCDSSSCSELPGRVCIIEDDGDGTFSTTCYEMSYADHLDNVANEVYTIEQVNWTWPGDCAVTPDCPIGHCCFVVMTKAQCAITVESTCDDFGGSWDEGAVHGETDCDSHGRCCDNADSEYCEVIPEGKCVGDGLVWIWGADCDPVESDCNFGHCCFLDEDFYAKCDLTLEAFCDALGGFWHEGLKCEDVDCTSHGRCCYFDASGAVLKCETEEWSKCEVENDRTFWSWPDDCVGDTPCITQGACCYVEEGIASCGQLPEDICTYLEGQWQSLLRCWEATCPDVGRCCFQDNATNSCLDTFEIDCISLGGTWSDGVSCDGPTCPPLGSCCHMVDAISKCVVNAELECNALEGSWSLGPGCDMAECDRGACCLVVDGVTECQVTFRETCRLSDGVWDGRADCSEVVCPQTGSCCFVADGDLACIETFEEVCRHNLVGSWAAGLHCSPASKCLGYERITLFSNMSTKGTDGYDHGQVNRPLVLGELDSTGEDIAAWAAPFVPETSGMVTDIYLPIEFLDETGPGVEWQDDFEDYYLMILPDSNGAPCEMSDYGWPDESDCDPGFSTFSRGLPFHCWAAMPNDDPLPTCDCGDPCDCHRRTHATRSYRINRSDSDLFTQPRLVAGERYWLVMFKPQTQAAGHRAFVWYRAHEDSVNQGANPHRCIRTVIQQSPPIVDVEPWEAQVNEVPGAFRIDGIADYCGLGTYPEYLTNRNCESEVESRCWFGHDTGVAGTTDVPYTGFPLNQNMWQIGPADYPPRKLDAVESSLPLVSREVSLFNGPVPHQQRPTHNDVIDLITGQPLLQAVDFELPFGGATFRHVRTYSEVENSMALPLAVDAASEPSRGAYWDWNGMFWMMSENPILLVDASFSRFGDPLIYPDDKRCYLIPDAHHAIPFLYDGEGKYEAPSWFDAVIMTSADPSFPEQIVDSDGRPEFYYVWLNRRSVKYTFRVRYEDLWTQDREHLFGDDGGDGDYPDIGPNVHDPASGYGYPYYGLIERIEDRYGNRIEYDYCGSPARDCTAADDPMGHGRFERPDCKVCCQDCNRKGQIRTVRLVSADGNVAWTLFYTHREFQPFNIMDEEFSYATIFHGSPIYAQNALHSIHVFEGQVDLPQGTDCLTIPASEFCGAETIADVEAIVHPAIAALENDWVIRSQYVYTEWGFVHTEGGPPEGDPCPSVGMFGASDGDYHVGCDPIDPDNPTPPLCRENVIGNRLRKVTTTRRKTGNEQNTEHSEVTIYRDKGVDHLSGLAFANGGLYLQSVYNSETIDSILEGVQYLAEDPSVPVSPDSLLTLPDSARVAFQNPETEAVEYRRLGDLADLWMEDASLYHDPPDMNPAILDELLPFMGGQPDRVLFQQRSRRRTFMADRRSDSTNSGDFTYRYYYQLPDSLEIGQGLTPTTRIDVDRRYPYRFQGTDIEPIGFEANEHRLDEPFFITVIDGTQCVDCTEDNPGGTDCDLPGEEPIRKTRRVVEMNGAGFVLRDRTWLIDEDFNYALIDQSGIGESARFDCRGRVIERRTKSWDVAFHNGDPDFEGLIEVYKYQDDACPVGTGDECDCAQFHQGSVGEAGELIAIGRKKGRLGTPIFSEYFERGEPSRPELVTRSIRFPMGASESQLPTGPADPVQSGWEYEETTFEFGVSEEGLESDRPIVSKTMTSAPTLSSEGGTQENAISRDYYDSNGVISWRMYGSVADPQNLTTATELYWDYTGTDDLGRPTFEVVDGDPSAPNAHTDFAGVTPPVGFVRVSATDPLNLTTKHEYEPMFGRTRTIFPSGREMRKVHINDADGSLHVLTFNDLVPAEGPDGETIYKSLTPPERIRISGNRLLSTAKLRVVSSLIHVDNLYSFQEGTDYEIISDTVPQYDSQGRVTGMRRRSGSADADDSEMIELGISYDGFGNINRQRSPDGTLTRHVYDEKGRRVATYRGLNDDHEYWGRGIACIPGENPTPENPCTPIDQFPDNLVLIEKRYYGTGINNADMLSDLRHYRDKPANQYHEQPLPEEDPENGIPPWPDGYTPPPENNEDEIGWVEHYGYDWRRRPVWMERRDAGGNPMTHSVTWYDNVDRPRIQAEYNAVPPDQSVDPRTLSPGSELPTVTAILSAPDQLPLTLEEMLYDTRGRVAERRTYDVSTGAYSSTRSYYGYHGKPTEVHTPGIPVTRNVYDAKGRVLIARSIAGSIEVARTDFVYGDMVDTACGCSIADDVAIQSTKWERSPGASGTALTDETAIRTFAQSWHDVAGRVIARVDYGSNGDTFVAHPGAPQLPEYDPLSPPVLRNANGDHVIAIAQDVLGDGFEDAMITAYDYDDKGRLVSTFHPKGTVTRKTYDDLGRKLTESHYASPEDSEEAFLQRTAHEYDAHGRLIKSAAVLPGFNGDYEAIWTSTDRVQISEFIYGADVYSEGADPGDAAVSRNNGLIAEVRYPNDVTGQPNPYDSIKFTYYPDGLVRTRTDARGVVLTHHFDELNRRILTEVDDSSIYPDPVDENGDGEIDEDVRPTGRVGRLEYEYTADGMPSLVTIRDAAGDVIAQNRFAYDERRNLVRDYQAHGELVVTDPPLMPEDAAQSRFVQYDWSFGDAEMGHRNRIDKITYPINPSGAAPREVSFNYGSGIDAILDRVVALNDSVLNQDVASYAYSGVGRRIGITYGNGVAQSFESSAGLGGLDRFGRVTDLHYTLNGATVHRYQYGYDQAGNRDFVRVTQATENQDGVPIPHDNDRSWLYGYDGLNRLVAADCGALNSEATDITANPPPGVPITTEWYLDSVGNWSGPASGVGRIQTFDVDGEGVQVQHSLTHNALANNELASIVEDGTSIGLVHDAVGNLIFDGQRDYFYDGLNRLIEIREQTGELTQQLRHDGLGRMTEMAWLLPGGRRKETHLYYDGVRRISEADSLWEPGSNPPQAAWMEYVYGPGYVDEFILTTNSLGAAQYILQDANHNVVAQLDVDGNVTCQNSWSPYGHLLAFETFGPSASDERLAIGHQGLFLVPFAGTLQAANSQDADEGLYYCRNRWYSPTMGRFTQRDPRGSGAVIIEVPVTAGTSWRLSRELFSSIEQFNDGMNLYTFESANPLIRNDAIGLSIGLSLVLGQAQSSALRNADAQASVRSGGFMISLLLRLLGPAIHLTGAGLSLWGSWELTRISGDGWDGNGLTKKQCLRLAQWCNYYRRLHCGDALRNCAANGRWDWKRWPLGPEANINSEPW